MGLIDAIESALVEAMQDLQKGLRETLTRQGHVLTGRLRDSIDFEITKGTSGVTAVMYSESYGLAMEFGVPADRIPYSGRGGRGGTSKYIQGLIRFFELRGVQGREAVSAAFATATKHKREGMPTRSSAAFSKNGKRTGFVRDTVEANLNRITDRIEEKTGLKIELFLFPEIENIEPIVVAA